MYKDHIKNNSGQSPHIQVLKNMDEFLQNILHDHITDNSNAKLLDVGGADGRVSKKLAPDYERHVMDIIKRPNAPKNLVFGDIMSCPELSDNSYDVVFSHTTLEHIENPWKAAKESIRILKPGGLTICCAPFSWRYHPYPIDVFRFSHHGLEILFQQSDNVKTLFSGYDISKRRDDMRGFWKNGLDATVVDDMGGWRENWMAVYVGKKQ